MSPSLVVQIFLSHKRADAKDFARALYNLLVLRGFTTFLDFEYRDELKVRELHHSGGLSSPGSHSLLLDLTVAFQAISHDGLQPDHNATNLTILRQQSRKEEEDWVHTFKACVHSHVVFARACMYGVQGKPRQL